MNARNIYAALFISLSSAAPSTGAVTLYEVNCTVIEVATLANRVHIRCAPTETPFWSFFSVPTSNSAESGRLVTLGTAAMTTGRPVRVTYDLTDFSAEAFGCVSSNCRRPLSVALAR